MDSRVELSVSGFSGCSDSKKKDGEEKEGAAASRGLNRIGGATWNPKTNAASTPNLRKLRVAKMSSGADPALYVARTQQNSALWQQIGRVEPLIEIPATRRDILNLEKHFDRAMHASEREIKQTRKPGTGLPAESRMEQDILAVREMVRELLKNAKIPADGDDKCFAELEADLKPEDLCTSAEVSQRDGHLQDMLTAAHYEQKWTDIVLGELQSQVSISCLEQGSLLQKLRIQMASCFKMLSEAHLATIEDFRVVRDKLLFYREKALSSMEKQKTLRRDIEQEFEKKLLMHEEKTQERIKKYQMAADEAKVTQKRMGQTLSALHETMKHMREEADVLRAIDISIQNEGLRTDLANAGKELQELRPLREEKDQLLETSLKQKRRIADLDMELAQQKMEIAQRDTLLKDLLEKHALSLQAEEMEKEMASGNEAFPSTDSPLKATTQNKKRAFVVGKDITKQKDTVKIPGEFHKLEGKPEGTRNQQASVLCPRCNKDLDNATKVEEVVERKRLLCEGYRMLLPNLRGYRPERSRKWTLRCMRSILRSKRCVDFASNRLKKPVTRFPEFVYLYFCPRQERLNELQSYEGIEAVAKARAKADEDRWALYYGMKTLAKELPEARMFSNFLDEKFGEDDFAFYLHCLTILEAVANEKQVILRWGENTDAADYDAMQQYEDEQGGQEEIEDFVFIEIRHAVETVERVMKRASEDDSSRLVKTLLERAVQEDVKIMPSTGQRIIDVNVCIRVLMLEYRQEQARRRAALRMMFGCATAGSESEGQEQRVKKEKTVDLRQLTTIVTALSSRASIVEAVTLYRLSHEIGNGKVDIDSFSVAADRMNFFSDCLRLPSNYGPETPNALSQAQCIQLGTQIRQQMAFLRPIIDIFMQSMDPSGQKELKRLVLDVSDELERGGLLLDGRRALCAIRRLLFFLLGERIGRREIYGERDAAGPDVTVVNAKREIEMICTILRDFQEPEQLIRLQTIQQKSSAQVIQRKWRQKQVYSVGVPFNMKKYMSSNFQSDLVLMENPIQRPCDPRQFSFRRIDTRQDLGSQTHSDKDLARKRLPRRPDHGIEFVLGFIDEVFKYKIEASSSTIEEAIHGFALQLIGVRSVAERFIFDFFTGVHRHAKENLRIRLFARFTGVRTPALEVQTQEEIHESEIRFGPGSDWFEEPFSNYLPVSLQSVDAVDTYLAALIVFVPPQEATSSLFLLDKISLSDAMSGAKTLFKGSISPSNHRPCGVRPSSKVLEECLTRMKRLKVTKGKVDLDHALLAVMQAWHSEHIYRLKALDEKIVEEPWGAGPEDVSRPKAKVAINKVVSHEEFEQHVFSILMGQNDKNHKVTEVYQTLVAACDPNFALAKEAVSGILKESRLCAWTPKVLEKHSKRKFPQDPQRNWFLFKTFWAPLHNSIETHVQLVCEQIEDDPSDLFKLKKKMTRREREEAEEKRSRTSKLRFALISNCKESVELLRRRFEECTQVPGAANDKKVVDELWQLARQFLAAFQRTRAELGQEHEPIPDKFDLQQMAKFKES